MTMKVPLVDLRATYLPIRQQLRESFDAIFEKMGLFLGENVQAFESEFTAYCQANFGLGCSNGTDALTLALRAFDFEAGFEAIIPSHTFFATVESVVHAGGVPVMVDVDPKTYTMDPDRTAAAITRKTAVIVPVHLYGQPADMDPILRTARDHGLKVIEDAAQAHGARYKGRPAGGLADAAAFSFYYTKNLGAFGEAGFVTAADEGVFERMKLLRHHGHSTKFDHTLIGYNMRIDELQAAVLRAKLPGLDANNTRRRAVARRYDEAFADLDVVTPLVADYAEPSYHCYVIQTQRRDELIHHLSECGIGTGIHYKRPAHLQPALKGIPHRALPTPVTDVLCERCLTLPCYPELTDDQIEHVIDSVDTFLG
jgi:dTDP-4-amino-4,6-dideoxygalactose transaminase